MSNYHLALEKTIPYKNLLDFTDFKPDINITYPVRLCLHRPKTNTPKVNTRKKIGFEALPPELILKVFGFLSINSLKNASLVSRAWYQIMDGKQNSD